MRIFHLISRLKRKYAKGVVFARKKKIKRKGGKKKKETTSILYLEKWIRRKEKSMFKINVLTQRHLESFHLPLFNKREKFICLKLNEIHQH